MVMGPIFAVCTADLRWTPHPVIVTGIVTVGDNRDYIRVLLCSYYTTITGWGVLLKQTPTLLMSISADLPHTLCMPEVQKLFGNLPVTMLSLWCAVSGGNDSWQPSCAIGVLSAFLRCCLGPATSAI